MVLVGVAVNVEEGRFVTGGEIVGGKQVNGLNIELALELMEFLGELAVLEVMGVLVEVTIMQGL
jgi:hypothetical protein